MRAFLGGVSILDEATLNALLTLQPFALVYDGTQFRAKTGSGVSENSTADYHHAVRVTLTGVSEFGRLEMNLDRDGAGVDLVVEIRDSDFNPDGSNDGTLLRTVIVPKEWIPDPAGWWSIPIALRGLTAGQNVWVVIPRRGDAINHIDLIGEASQDGNHPVYRRAGSSGAWSAHNAVHFRAYAGTAGEVLHGMYAGQAWTMVEFANEVPTKLYRFVPSPDGVDGGVRDVLELVFDGEHLVGGEV